MTRQDFQQSIKAGAIYTILTMAGAASLGALVKWASGGFSSEFLTSVRFFSGFMIMILIYALGRRGSLKTKSFGIQFGVAASWVLCILIYYVSIRFIPLMDATLLLNTAAIFGPILANSSMASGNRSSSGWVPRSDSPGSWSCCDRVRCCWENPMSLIGIMAGFFAGLRLLFNSKLKEDSAQCTTFYSLLLGSGICLLILLSVGVPIRAPHWETMMFSPRDSMSPWFVDSSLILVVVIFGLLSMLIPWFTAKGLSHASVGQIAPFRYTAVIFAGLLDWAIWDVVPTWPSYAGFALVWGGR